MKEISYLASADGGIYYPRNHGREPHCDQNLEHARNLPLSFDFGHVR